MINHNPLAALTLTLTGIATLCGAMVLAAPVANAQAVGPCVSGCGPVSPPVIPPPVVVVTPPPPPPPVVVVTTPTPPPPPTPTPPQGMFTNLPSDMRSMTQFDSIPSINRLISEPGALNLSAPRQAHKNPLENRKISGPTSGTESQRAIQALESAKPLI